MYIIKRTEVDVIGWKQVFDCHRSLNILAKLYIPKHTLVGGNHKKEEGEYSAAETEERKLRAEHAFVLGFHWMDGTKINVDPSRVVSMWDTSFVYERNKWVRPIKVFSMVKDECESGIHFFLTRKEAKEY